MAIHEVVVKLPRYVLMEGNRRLGPQVAHLEEGKACLAIFGFSDKGSYDTFCSNSDLALAPYPLVTGFLRNQLDDTGAELKLMVLDAAGPRDSCLHAAPMKSVLEALEHGIAHLTTDYQLVLDPQTNAYRLEEALCG